MYLKTEELSVSKDMHKDLFMTVKKKKKEKKKEK